MVRFPTVVHFALGGQIVGDDAEIAPTNQTSLPPSLQAYLSKQGFGSGDNCLDFPLR